MNEIGVFANDVWEDLGSPTSPSVAYISGWAESNLGTFNVRLNTTFCISGGGFSPDFGNAESGIYKELFNVKFYESKIRDAANDTLSASGSLSWISIKEGDTSIQRSNPTTLLQLYRGLRNDSRDELNRLVKAYKANLSAPRQVVPCIPNG